MGKKNEFARRKYPNVPMFCKSTEKGQQLYKFVDCVDEQIFAAHAGGSVSLKASREAVNEHIDQLRALQTLGYRKTTQSNAEKAAYYKRTYNAIAASLAEKIDLSVIEQAINGVVVEYHNTQQLDMSMKGLTFPNCMILGPRFVMAQLASLRDTAQGLTRDTLDTLYNKVAVQAGVILYGEAGHIDQIEARITREAAEAEQAEAEQAKAEEAARQAFQTANAKYRAALAAAEEADRALRTATANLQDVTFSK